MTNNLHCYGNCTKHLPGEADEGFRPLIEDGPEGLTFDDECYLREGVHSIHIRGRVVPINTDLAYLRSKGIELEEPPRIQVFELLRSLLPEYRELMLAAEAEFCEQVPPDLPCVLRLEEWHHPDLANEELPSECSTFRMIAKALAFGDPSPYRPTEEPNTHWRNWPEGGTL